jgi:hypothetical protein
VGVSDIFPKIKRGWEIATEWRGPRSRESFKHFCGAELKGRFRAQNHACLLAIAIQVASRASAHLPYMQLRF